MKLILACIDFSPVTDLVLNTAADLARETKARLIIAHVIVRPVPMVDGACTTMLENASLLGEQVRPVQERLDQLCNRVHQVYGLNATTIVLDGMQAAAPLKERAARLGPDLIVIGSHGYGLLDRLLMGSTSNGIIHNAKWPVLVIPSAMAAAAGQPAKTAELAAAGR